MKSEDTTTQTGKIIQINEARVRDHRRSFESMSGQGPAAFLSILCPPSPGTWRSSRD